MKIYWTPKSIPELQDLPWPAAMQEYRSAYFQSWGHWRGWLSMLVLLLVVALGTKLVQTLFPYSPGNESLPRQIGELSVAIFASFLYGQLSTQNVRYFLQRKNDVS